LTDPAGTSFVLKPFHFSLNSKVAVARFGYEPARGVNGSGSPGPHRLATCSFRKSIAGRCSMTYGSRLDPVGSAREPDRGLHPGRPGSIWQEL